MIRHAKILEIPDILKLTEACAKDMIHRGIYQWNEDYPSKEIFKIDISRNELFVLEEDRNICGIIVLTPLMDKEYRDIIWTTPNKDNLYIHRLAVLPELQGKGKAQLLMDYAENFGRKNRYKSIRLDTFSENIRNQRFYETRGYKKLGSIYFPKQSESPFYCYELVL
ncbi:GNAT family N-acetyltransferase [Eudoraea chungangensis]|uniref:GNAT family N-acetyltransferase n=1 Tax=Eudoraea chungangensis TaxID=1481905 RepID=UPI0023EDC0D6|nr:GNAT family N-acetyltransferase [Eudoraea chungangensis]